MNIQPIKIRSTVINSNQFIHGTNQFIQQLGPLAFEGQFDLTAYLKVFLDEYNNENKNVGSVANQNIAGTSSLTETLLQYTYIEPDTLKTGGLAEVLVRATNVDFYGDAQIYIYANCYRIGFRSLG